VKETYLIGTNPEEQNTKDSDNDEAEYSMAPWEKRLKYEEKTNIFW
jgi:hypothetical protein